MARPEGGNPGPKIHSQPTLATDYTIEIREQEFGECILMQDN
jgi:hypothetical protein